MINPCCCISPRIGSFILAIINLIFAALCVFRVVGVLVNGIFGYLTWSKLFSCICLILLAFLLLIGTFRNSEDLVELWLILWAVWLVVVLMFQVVYTLSDHVGPDIVGSALLGFFIFLFQIGVVYSYLRQLRHGRAELTVACSNFFV